MRINDIPTEQLKLDLAAMKRTDELYRIIKEELMHRGNWKHAPRGNQFKKGVDPRRKDLTKPKTLFNDLYHKP